MSDPQYLGAQVLLLLKYELLNLPTILSWPLWKESTIEDESKWDHTLVFSWPERFSLTSLQQSVRPRLSLLFSCVPSFWGGRGSLHPFKLLMIKSFDPRLSALIGPIVMRLVNLRWYVIVGGWTHFRLWRSLWNLWNGMHHNVPQCLIPKLI